MNQNVVAFCMHNPARKQLPQRCSVVAVHQQDSPECANSPWDSFPGLGGNAACLFSPPLNCCRQFRQGLHLHAIFTKLKKGDLWLTGAVGDGNRGCKLSGWIIVQGINPRFMFTELLKPLPMTSPALYKQHMRQCIRVLRSLQNYAYTQRHSSKLRIHSFPSHCTQGFSP